MIDLSFLTEEEHETILRVLQRDAQLKMAEEKRIKSLQRSVKDRGLLKYLSGEWFYERKLLRHRDRIHGCDIIRASIRHKHKPVTLLELSQMIPEKPSFVASVNKEVYIPPELCGLIPEDPQNRRNENWISFGSSKETPKSNIQSPTKLRKNPFNQEALAPTKPPEVTRDPASANNEQAVDKPLNPTPARHEEPLSSAEFPLSHSTNPNQEPLECIPEEDTNTSSPFPLYRRTSLFYLSQDGASQAHYPTPRGILKVMSDQGSTDSLVTTGAVPQSSPDRSSAAEDAAPTGRDALGKQVRFGPAVGQGEPQLEEMEPREHSLLDVDHVVGSLSAEDNNDGGTAGVCRPLLRQVAVGSQEIPVVMPEVSAHQVPGDLSEQYHDQFPQVSKPLSTEQESGYDEGDSSPVRSASKQRQMPMSQSMENLGARTEEDKGQGSSLGQLNLSMDDVGAAVPPASLHPDPLQVRRMSKSVPALQQLEETDDDDDDESFGTKPRRRTTSVVSNLSLSSGLASMSSVSGSMTSISNGDFGDIEVQGTMQFALNYVQKLGELQIFVVQCKDLALAEPKKSRSDPYVKCYLVPDKTKLGKRKTTVKKRTLNPSYNEILRFKILMEVLRMQNLNISVWHNDTFGRNSFLGEISLDLSEWDFANTQINDYALTPRPLSQFPSPLAMRSKPTNKTGQMRVALRYLPQPSHGKKTSKMEPGEVQIWVKDCKDLPPARGVIIDPFVKCTVLPDTSKKSRQKTRVVKRTANPMFNHTMVYDGFRPEDLREACAEITVWDHDRLNNHYIGGLRLGLGTGKSYGGEVDWMDSSEPETNLWEKMMGSEGEWVEDILPLRTFVVAKSRAK
ncbi:synaptotagmin-like protein 1 isoform X8 [Gadus chalcogrammus]|uniref:synaptotagmin-like protein 1 isoform X8 n=1 Tax=Gadus chalcogrammus TaxID=1042646 RepID=UPI0024C2CD0A|nr:synaptotagmin-like protein 1 isoform X8 [Gadus chalcogrammus]